MYHLMTLLEELNEQLHAKASNISGKMNEMAEANRQPHEQATITFIADVHHDLQVRLASTLAESVAREYWQDLVTKDRRESLQESGESDDLGYDRFLRQMKR